jgi:hypothetical protein
MHVGWSEQTAADGSRVNCPTKEGQVASSAMILDTAITAGCWMLDAGD